MCVNQINNNNSKITEEMGKYTYFLLAFYSRYVHTRMDCKYSLYVA